jgi:hypothetical protein
VALAKETDDLLWPVYDHHKKIGEVSTKNAHIESAYFSDSSILASE